jgi:signal transduction histidine kinase
VDKKARSIFSELFVGTLVLLCGVLGALQYRWNAEVSAALRDRLHASLAGSLDRLSRDINAEIAAASMALMPPSPHDAESAEQQMVFAFGRWSGNARHRQIVRRVALAVPSGDAIELRMLDMERAVFVAAPWPEEWKPLGDRLERMGGRGPGPGGHGGPEGTVFEEPLFPPDFAGGPPRPSFGWREIGWVIFDINADYVRDTLLPEALQRHLASGNGLDYQVEVVDRFDTSEVIYRSDRSADLVSASDASVALFDLTGRRPGRGPDFHQVRGGSTSPGEGSGRWELYVRHKAGSLEAVVAQTRRRNLGVTGGVLLLMLATVGAWVRYTRRAQRLAELQMDFVAGISHELRTPLTVIHTAGYNLQGKMAANPAQVERYGKLIQQESGRLKDIVEQVLQFAGTKAGRVLQQREPIEVEEMIDQTIEASGAVVEAAHCVVEKKVEVGLPAIYGDPRALRLALENLVSNSAKYASGPQGWIGISAVEVEDRKGRMVEIRVADRGPGIPPEEQRHIFDPFFRGRRAIEDQVHGTGLGLSLVKKIVEAHGGTVAVGSGAQQGAEFIVRIPAMGTGA